MSESMPEPKFVDLEFERLEPEVQRARLESFLERMRRRRTVRDYAPDPVPIELIEAAIAAAATAPSGANMQPWRFVVVRDPAIKRRIREAAEAEERESYERRMPENWLRRLAPLGTDWRKPFLEVAPYLIVVFKVEFEVDESGDREPTYYAAESVGIAVGLLLAALHSAGLATLTHTPSPMRFLSEILERPRNERPFVLIPVGYPAPGARVPDIERKPLGEVMTVV
jgi:iodotyrosine deiodinase